jgi:RNA recognition motif-containing protein
MTSIFVAKLDFGVTKEQLSELFEVHGKVNRVNIPTDKDTGKPRGFAFVEMYDADEANKAISALDGYEINRRRLAVKIAENRGDQKRSGNKPFHSNHKKESNSSVPSREASESSTTSDPNEFKNQESRKKTSKNKKRSFDSDMDRSKKTKMTAHKKSGKNFRYFEDDEPLENDLFSFNNDEDVSLD